MMQHDKLIESILKEPIELEYYLKTLGRLSDYLLMMDITKESDDLFNPYFRFLDRVSLSEIIRCNRHLIYEVASIVLILNQNNERFIDRDIDGTTEMFYNTFSVNWVNGIEKTLIRKIRHNWIVTAFEITGVALEEYTYTSSFFEKYLYQEFVNIETELKLSRSILGEEISDEPLLEIASTQFPSEVEKRINQLLLLGCFTVDRCINIIESLTDDMIKLLPLEKLILVNFMIKKVRSLHNE
ncbi:hypothetical protein G7062_04260 [Erysipelothrix sp. HDW6C]|uniref:hypothetical protein n=1 Tax=Erysipelothrix sp. HDW6C TaxID=2714930 RepID=UPI00140E8AE9|nr:hypothetical protein [Erysipelothrix sp. HDW6C]QIK69556.1 hypothetical protein G7062_04260 [Erysipelothrix sp. HDW6C]